MCAQFQLLKEPPAPIHGPSYRSSCAWRLGVATTAVNPTATRVRIDLKVFMK